MVYTMFCADPKTAEREHGEDGNLAGGWSASEQRKHRRNTGERVLLFHNLPLCILGTSSIY